MAPSSITNVVLLRRHVEHRHFEGEIVIVASIYHTGSWLITLSRDGPNHSSSADSTLIGVRQRGQMLSTNVHSARHEQWKTCPQTVVSFGL